MKSINNYGIVNVLGEGAFGKVKLATKTSKEFGGFEKKYALKVYKKAKLRKKKNLVKGQDGSKFSLNFYFILNFLKN